MKTFLLLTVALSLACAMSPAQQNPSKPKKVHGKQNAIRGCLSGAPGVFTLASHSGMTYELTGDEAELSKLVGKEVTVTGLAGSASDVSTGISGPTGESTSNPTAGSAPTIQVKSATKIADTCSKKK